MMKITYTPFRDWPWHARAFERLYRATHGGMIRTLVIPLHGSADPEGTVYWAIHDAAHCQGDCARHPGGIR
jgi:hypothetical protein